ncbi:DUF6157 family protein [Luethyella okanaganae]|uniref:DUF6157 family protein n=1 Tax=Luethyella okanaganae TaxID=69372 RepID=A0ABW1VGW4_9MICO
MDRVDYVNTFIAVAEDCAAVAGTVPPEKAENPSIAARTCRMIAENPYGHTSGDVIFEVYADRAGIPDAERPEARAAYYGIGRACLRSSDLGKRYGWGIHADERGRIALVGVETEEYARLASGVAVAASGAPIVVTRAMRGSRR